MTEDLFSPEHVSRLERYQQARAVGAEAEIAVTQAAERRKGFDTEGAIHTLVGLLSAGPRAGEELVDVLKVMGYQGHDDRCFGSVFSSASRRGLIECAGYTPRIKGHGTAGGRVWRLTSEPETKHKDTL